MKEKKTMRQLFGETLVSIAEQYPQMIVLDADVSSSTQTRLFNREYPDRFFNFGIAEGNMIAAGAGMATCGKIPVVSTFAFLIAMRALDAVSSTISYNRLNVKLCGGYAGLSDHADGASHQSLSDIAIMRSLPNMRVLSPSDIESTQAAVRYMLEYDGPIYLRLSRDYVDSLHEKVYTSDSIEKVTMLRDGYDAVILATGPLLKNAIGASELLKKDGVTLAVAEAVCLKPLDKETIRDLAVRYPVIITLEEHSVIGGLGDAVASIVSEVGNARVKKIGVEDVYGQSARSYSELLAAYGLDEISVAEKVKKALENKGGEENGGCYHWK